MHWKTTTILLCVYSITKGFRPPTPFLTWYLVSPYKSFTLDEVYFAIFSLWTYSYMLFLVPVFSLTDTLRYKPVIMLVGPCLSLTWILLERGEGIVQMRLMQIASGALTLLNYPYLYAIVNERNYRRVTSYDRSADLTRKLLLDLCPHFPLNCCIFDTESGVKTCTTICNPFELNLSDVGDGLVEVMNAVTDWVKYGELVSLSSLLTAIVLVLTSQTDYIWRGYICVTATRSTLITPGRCGF
uniref:Transmembrane protein 135 n=1 Tax=Angiostrongylus cantonensis TaxID=6313 RepID=A0A0K0CZS0_ANGCA